MRTIALLLCVSASAPSLQAQADRPKWLDDMAHFCTELAKRTNKGQAMPVLKPVSSLALSQYPAQPVMEPRTGAAIISSSLGLSEFHRAVRSEAAKGPDFAGRYAIVRWTCGSNCSNQVIADVKTGTRYETPFVGISQCIELTGFATDDIERRADSLMVIVRGSLEIQRDRGSFLDDGPCGTFAYLWQKRHLSLIGCEFSDEANRKG